MSHSALLESLRPKLPLIAPSMLKCDFGNLHREVELLDAAGAQLLHWDVMDGHFVPNLSYGALLIERIRPRTEMIFDVHLMISDPDKYLDEYVKAGADWITVHIEACGDGASATLRRIREAGCKAGITLNPETPVEQIEPLLDDCDLVLFMSVSPGFGGQKFRPEVLPKLEYVRAKRPNMTISIDGGIGPATIPLAAAAGANVFVAGSSIFEEADYGTAMRTMREKALEGVS